VSVNQELRVSELENSNLRSFEPTFLSDRNLFRKQWLEILSFFRRNVNKKSSFLTVVLTLQLRHTATTLIQ
jgi:hypothetical protein